MTGRKWFLKYLLLCVVTTSLFACSTDPRKEEARGFVQNYCSVLQAAYAKADLKLLTFMATEKELKKLYPVVQAMQVTGNAMPTEILEFKVKQAKVKGDRATVKTSEKWRYWWVDQKSGAITKPKHEESYDLEYNLVKIAGAWKVDFIKNLNE